MSSYVSLQGKVYFAKITGGVAGAIQWRGNVPKFDLKVNAQTINHTESSSGERTEDLRLVQTKSVMWDATIEELTADNTAFVLNGTNHEIAGETVTDRSLGTVVVGKEIMLSAYNLTSVTVKDSAGTPAVVATNKYELDADFGTIVFNDVTGLTQPLKISYTSADITATTIASSDNDEYMVFFKGINTVTGEKVALELWRNVKEPESTMPLINEALASYSVSGRCLSDLSKKNSPGLGLFGRFIKIGSPAEEY